eukprot:9343-Heterococcus_DN1.PRE.3
MPHAMFLCMHAWQESKAQHDGVSSNRLSAEPVQALFGHYELGLRGSVKALYWYQAPAASRVLQYELTIGCMKLMQVKQTTAFYYVYLLQQAVRPTMIIISLSLHMHSKCTAVDTATYIELHVYTYAAYNMQRSLRYWLELLHKPPRSLRAQCTLYDYGINESQLDRCRIHFTKSSLYHCSWDANARVVEIAALPHCGKQDVYSMRMSMHLGMISYLEAPLGNGFY